MALSVFLSNAFKFDPRGGEVAMAVDATGASSLASPIAHFGKIRVSIWIGVNALLFIACFVGILVPPHSMTFWTHLWSRDGLLNPWAVAVVTFAAPLLVVVVGVMLKQLFFRQSWAIWLENDRLLFLNFYGAVRFSALTLTDIERFSIGSKRVFQPTGIIAHLKNGYQAYIPTILLHESRERIFSDLSQLLRSSIPAHS
jgi:hypothetical protein